MISFKEFIQEEVTEEEIDALIESLEWEDVIHLFDEEDMIIEDISAKERIKKGQRLKSRKVLMALARKVKLKRSFLDSKLLDEIPKNDEHSICKISNFKMIKLKLLL